MNLRKFKGLALAMLTLIVIAGLAFASVNDNGTVLGTATVSGDKGVVLDPSAIGQIQISFDVSSGDTEIMVSDSAVPVIWWNRNLAEATIGNILVSGEPVDASTSVVKASVNYTPKFAGILKFIYGVYSTDDAIVSNSVIKISVEPILRAYESSDIEKNLNTASSVTLQMPMDTTKGIIISADGGLDTDGFPGFHDITLTSTDDATLFTAYGLTVAYPGNFKNIVSVSITDSTKGLLKSEDINAELSINTIGYGSSVETLPVKKAVTIQFNLTPPAATGNIALTQPVSGYATTYSLDNKAGSATLPFAVEVSKEVTMREISWENTNPAAATFNNNTHILTAVADGRTTVRAVFKHYPTISAECIVDVASTSVVAPVTAVALNKTSLDLKIGATEKLVATVQPGDLSVDVVVWSSDKPAIATVNSADGTVTAVTAGKAIITATTKGTNSSGAHLTASCDVTVHATAIPVTGITISKSDFTLMEGAVYELTALISPDNATSKDVTWTSSNPAAATITDTSATKAGTASVHALKAGETTITATAKDGGRTATCKITVKANPLPIPASVEIVQQAAVIPVAAPTTITATNNPVAVILTATEAATAVAAAAVETKINTLSETVQGAFAIAAEQKDGKFISKVINATSQAAANAIIVADLGAGHAVDLGKVYNLPVFSVTLPAGKTQVLFASEVKFPAAFNASSLRIVKATNTGGYEVMKPANTLDNIPSGSFIVTTKAGAIVRGAQSAGGTFDVTVCVADQSGIDFDTVAGNVIDPGSLVEVTGTSTDPNYAPSSSGCASFAFAPFALLFLLPLALRKKN